VTRTPFEITPRNTPSTSAYSGETKGESSLEDAHQRQPEADEDAHDGPAGDLDLVGVRDRGLRPTEARGEDEQEQDERLGERPFAVIADVRAAAGGLPAAPWPSARVAGAPNRRPCPPRGCLARFSFSAGFAIAFLSISKVLHARLRDAPRSPWPRRA